MMDRRNFLKLLGAATAVPLLSSCALVPGSGPNPAVKEAGTGRFTVGLLPFAHFAGLYAAEREKLFKKAGLDIKVQTFQNAPGVVPSLINGQIGIGTASGAPYINAVSRNVPLRAVAPAAIIPTAASKDTADLIVGSNVTAKTWPDLKGSTIATNTLGSQPHIAVQKLMADQGMSSEDIDVVAMAIPDALAAMKQGKIDGVMAPEPFITVGTQGGARIFETLYYSAFKKPGAESIFHTTSDVIDARRDELKEFQKAIIQGNRLLSEDPKFAVEIYTKDLGMEADLAQEMMHPEYETKELSADALIDISQVMTELDLLMEPLTKEQVIGL